jgi:two-component system sensor histidine kinase HydH
MAQPKSTPEDEVVTAAAEPLPGGLPSQVLDALDQVVVAVDRDRRVVYANRRLEDLLGIRPESLLGQPARDLFQGIDAKWLRGASSEAREFRLSAAEGREVTLKAEAMAMRSDSGELLGSVILADAVAETEHGEFQKKIDRLVSLGELSAYVAHEIRNPLTGIRTTVQFVSSKLKPNDARREDLDDVIKELDRIEQIITGLLLFARPQSGRPTLTSVHGVIEKTLAGIELHLADAGVAIERDLAEDLPEVWLDPDLIHQVFLNLCLNAIQAMPTGGTLKVTTGVRRYRTRRSFVDVSFTDSGVGIPREAMEKIFDPFFTTRSMGTGLGLSISLQIIRDHGGVITARNNSGGGATFRVSFPLPVDPAEKP